MLSGPTRSPWRSPRAMFHMRPSPAKRVAARVLEPLAHLSFAIARMNGAGIPGPRRPSAPLSIVRRGGCAKGRATAGAMDGTQVNIEPASATAA